MFHLPMQRVSMARALSVEVWAMGTLLGKLRLLVGARLVAALPHLRPLPIQVHRVWRVRASERMAVVARILRHACAVLPRGGICMAVTCPTCTAQRAHRHRHRNGKRSSICVTAELRMVGYSADVPRQRALAVIDLRVAKLR